MKKNNKKCRWKWCEQREGYFTRCRFYFSFEGYEVNTNAYKFCPGCGRKIEVKDEE